MIHIDGKSFNGSLRKAINKIAGERELEILENLSGFELIKDKLPYKVYRFWHKSGDKFFDYDENSGKIVG